jgi:hypothetical protein
MKAARAALENMEPTEQEAFRLEMHMIAQLQC